MAPRSLDQLSDSGKHGVRRAAEDGVGRNWLGEPLNDQSLMGLVGAWLARVALPVLAVLCPLAALHATLRPVLDGQWPDVLVLPTVVAWLLIGGLVVLVLRSRDPGFGGGEASAAGLSVQVGSGAQRPYVSAADVYGEAQVSNEDIERLLDEQQDDD